MNFIHFPDCLILFSFFSFCLFFRNFTPLSEVIILNWMKFVSSGPGVFLFYLRALFAFSSTRTQIGRNPQYKRKKVQRITKDAAVEKRTIDTVHCKLTNTLTLFGASFFDVEKLTFRFYKILNFNILYLFTLLSFVTFISILSKLDPSISPFASLYLFLIYHFFFSIFTR